MQIYALFIRYQQAMESQGLPTDLTSTCSKREMKDRSCGQFRDNVSSGRRVFKSYLAL